MEVDLIERIEDIRLHSKRERKLIAELNVHLGVEFREYLEMLSELLDHVDAYFRDAEMLREPKTGVALARWLARSERTLELAEKTRRRIKRIVETFGANANSPP